MSMDGLFAWKSLYDPPRFLFREFWDWGRLSLGVNIPVHVPDHCPVYYEIEYMELSSNTLLLNGMLHGPAG